jgi:voltage-gated sodium channel
VRTRHWVGSTSKKNRRSESDRNPPSKKPEETPSPSSELPAKPPPGGIRGWAVKIVDAGWFQNFIVAVIVFNAFTLGLETSNAVSEYVGIWFDRLDDFILGIFVVEIVLKMTARGIVGFFRRGWNIFDFIIVGMSLVPSAGPLTVLRALRILRVLRLVSVVPAMRKVVQALLTSIPGVASIMALMLLVFYIFGVICTKLYGETFPQWFGTIGESMYSLFQIMTLESWSMGIVRPVMEQAPQAWLVFVPFILITSFAVLNLFIAVIVNAMQEQATADLEEARDTIEEDIHEQTRVLTAEIADLRGDLRELKGMLDKPAPDSGG